MVSQNLVLIDSPAFPHSCFHLVNVILHFYSFYHEHYISRQPPTKQEAKTLESMQKLHEIGKFMYQFVSVLVKLYIGWSYLKQCFRLHGTLH